MTTTEKDKLKHDFINSIVIINSLTKTAATFISELSNNSTETEINRKKMEKFGYAMDIIQQQTLQIESYFHRILNKIDGNS